MTTTSKKFSENFDPEIPKERIIDALKSSNKLDAAQATAMYQIRNAVLDYHRQMGVSHEGLSEQFTNELNRMCQLIVGDLEAQFKEQKDYIKDMLTEPLKVLEKVHDIVLMNSKIPPEIPDGEYLEDPDKAEPF